MPESIEKKTPSVERAVAPEQSPEHFSGPEKKLEQSPEKAAEQSTEQVQASEVAMPQTASTTAPLASDDQVILKEVENILSDNMDKVFLSMDANSQQIFKVKGEETARKITVLMKQATLKAKDVVTIILEWLRIIPKVNKHFIEQEAKIKADHILKMHKNKNQ